MFVGCKDTMFFAYFCYLFEGIYALFVQLLYFSAFFALLGGVQLGGPNKIRGEETGHSEGGYGNGGERRWKRRGIALEEGRDYTGGRRGTEV